MWLFICILFVKNKDANDLSLNLKYSNPGYVMYLKPSTAVNLLIYDFIVKP